MSDLAQPMNVLVQNHEHSESMNELFGALAKAQAKELVAPFNRTNPAFKRSGPDGKPQESKYADLTSIMRTLSASFPEFGLCVMQFPKVNAQAKTVSVRTVLGHSSGQWAACTVDISVPDTTAHKVAAGITYGRRIGLSITGVVADEDDDGNSASGVADHVGASPPLKYEPPTSLPFKMAGGVSAPAKAGPNGTAIEVWSQMVEDTCNAQKTAEDLMMWWSLNGAEFAGFVQEHHPEAFASAKAKVKQRRDELRKTSQLEPAAKEIA